MSLPVPGEILGARFEIVGAGGEGGMATVFRARDRQTGQIVAAKVLRDDRHRERFRAECETLATLDSRWVVRHFGHGETRSGRLWLAMEWLEGEDLGKKLEKGPLGIGSAVDLVMRVAEALGSAHALGIVHRDVKPDNIILVGGDPRTPRLVDFGIARFPGKRFTEPGLVLGTPAYFAPEQARADAALDPRADVFALGSLLFECITGVPLWDGESIVAILTKILFEPAPRLDRQKPEVPSSLAELVELMLDKDPEKRPRSGEAVASALLSVDLRDTTLGAASRSEPPPPRGIGERERSIGSVLVARPPKGALTPEVGASLRALGERFGVVPEELADGSVAVLVSGARAATDLALIACRLALALSRVLPSAAIGLATGRTTLGERSELGRVIARASALVPEGASGIRIDPTTASLAGESFVLSSDGGHTVLRGEQAASRSAGPEALRGRDEELSLVARSFERVVTRSEAAGLLLLGDAGMGKTALVRAAIRQLADHPTLPTVLQARGEPLRENVPFALVADLVRGAVGLRDVTDPGAEGELTTWAGARLDGPEGMAAVGVLAELLRIGPSPAERSLTDRPSALPAGTLADRAADALTRALGAELKGVPLVLLLEDLHVADAPSVQLVATLLSRLEAEPLFVLATGRPEAAERARALAEVPHVEIVELGPLTSDVMRAWIEEGLGPGVPKGRAEDLARSAGGSPFVLRELIRAVRSGGAHAPQAAALAVHARLEALPAPVRKVLRAASVVGVFDEADVEHLTKSPSRDALEVLVREDVLVREAGSLGVRYAFQSRLLEEVAYGMLTAEDRALAHALAAERLAEKGGAPAALAEHLSRSGDVDRASRALAKAAREALIASDVVAAAALAEKGLALDAKKTVLAELHAAYAEARLWQGHPAAGRAAAEKARSLAEPGSLAEASALSVLLTAAGRLGDVDGLERTASEMVLLDVHAETAPVLALGLARGAMNLMFLGRFEAGAALLVQLRELASAFPDRANEARLAQAESVKAHYEGDLSTHFAFAKKALETFDALGDRRTAAVMRTNLGSALRSAGQLEEAREVLTEALAQTRTLGLGGVEAPLRANLGITLARLGRIDEGLAELETAAAALTGAHERRLAASAAIYLCEVHLLRGDVERAWACAESALSQADQGTPIRPFALARAADVRRALGDGPGALGYAEAAMDALASLAHVEDGELEPHVALIEALLLCGETERAKEAAGRARDRMLEIEERVSDPGLRAELGTRVAAMRRVRELANELGA